MVSLSVNKAEACSKKKKRNIKQPEPDIHHKRRRLAPRNANVRGNLQGNGKRLLSSPIKISILLLFSRF